MYASVCPSFENWRLAVVAKICPLSCPKKFLVGGYLDRAVFEQVTISRKMGTSSTCSWNDPKPFLGGTRY